MNDWRSVNADPLFVFCITQLPCKTYAHQLWKRSDTNLVQLSPQAKKLGTLSSLQTEGGGRWGVREKGWWATGSGLLQRLPFLHCSFSAVATKKYKAQGQASGRMSSTVMHCGGSRVICTSCFNCITSKGQAEMHHSETTSSTNTGTWLKAVRC